MTTFAQDEINRRLATDARFREDYKANPKPVLAQFGHVYPESVSVHIVETSPAAYALILGAEDTYGPGQLESMPPSVATVVKRSFTDSGFRHLLTANPVEAIFLETGFRVPEAATVTVFETTATDVYLPLPSMLHEFDGEELSELELEEITGGVQASSIIQFFQSTTPLPFTNGTGIPGIS